MQRWEYKTLRQSVSKDHMTMSEEPDFDKQLSSFGAQGWELVEVQPITVQSSSPGGVAITGGFLYVFRRPLGA